MRHALFKSFVLAAGCLAAGMLGLTGCVDEPALDEPAGDPPAHPTGTFYAHGDEEQGRHILGSFADTLAGGGSHFHVSVIPSNRPGFRISVAAAGINGVAGANLVAELGLVKFTGADPWFVGTTFVAAGGAELRIRGVARRGTTTSTTYFLDYRSNPAGTWADYCPGVGVSERGAVAVHGSYDARRIHFIGPTITFACADGVAAKCHDWGYVAGNAGARDDNWDHNQACSAMANADYCRSGVSYTREKTPIRIRDFVQGYASPDPIDLTHPDPLPGDPDEYYFEAAWRPGALAPVCLSRIRWAALPPDPCPGVLIDPRFHLDDKDDDVVVAFCDDLTPQMMKDLGAVIVNGSRVMDAPLARWRHAFKNDIVTTIRGFYMNRDGNPGADADSVFPFPGYTEYLGVDSMILRNLPGTIAVSEMFPLHLQQSTLGEYVVASTTKLPDHTLAASSFEGYSFLKPDRVPNLSPLKVCQVGDDFRTTIGTPPGCIVAQSLKFALPPP